MSKKEILKKNSELIEEISHVIDKEWEYIRMRRQLNNVNDQARTNLTGICFSGGGIRSATFCLGIMQGLIKAGIFRIFDYLSTVSGGGYIGSCLTSLLSKVPETGVDKDNSPFVGLREKDNYTAAEETKLGVRHQLHHLRTNGMYLIKRKKLFSRDVQRAVGTVIAGIAHHLFLFLLCSVIIVCLFHLALTAIVDQNFNDLGYPSLTNSVPVSLNKSQDPGTEPGIVDELSMWYKHCESTICSWFGEEWIRDHRFKWSLTWTAVAFLAAGFLWTAIFVRCAVKRAEWISEHIKAPPPDQTKAGFNIEEYFESKFITKFNLFSILVVFILVMLTGFLNNFHYTPVVLMPFCFAVGGKVASYFMVHLTKSGLDDQKRIHRSLYNGIQGATSYGLIFTLILPVILVLFFSMRYFSPGFSWSVISLLFSYFLLFGKTGGSGRISKLLIRFQKPLLNVMVIIFLFFTLLLISNQLIDNIYPWLNLSTSLLSLIIGAGVAIVFCALGILFNANRISPHYFYRDRLTETYLKTDARVKRDEKCSRQGMPLMTLRNDENLRLRELGNDNNRGPYHLIVTALNLQGSDELNRKTMLSEHFIFSKEFVGSKITGYLPTAKYRGGMTKLARAMTISGAAAASAMGKYSFLAQSFAMTLFNTRLGYWMANPWYAGCCRQDPEEKRIFWPVYLWLEMFGRITARKRLINLSDGGHTGDNLGLIPLLQRRCKLIVICDAEADANYSFESFNTAVRMAYIEDNIVININLESLRPKKDELGEYKFSKNSHVKGEIEYPDIGSGKEKGVIIYLKSSVSEKKHSNDSEKIPVHVVNYRRNHSAYPHESTGDQFFDDAQFEAYRALGQHIAEQATPTIEKDDIFKQLV